MGQQPLPNTTAQASCQLHGVNEFGFRVFSFLFLYFFFGVLGFLIHNSTVLFCRFWGHVHCGAGPLLYGVQGCWSTVTMNNYIPFCKTIFLSICRNSR